MVHPLGGTVVAGSQDLLVLDNHGTYVAAQAGAAFTNNPGYFHKIMVPVRALNMFYHFTSHNHHRTADGDSYLQCTKDPIAGIAQTRQDIRILV